ncbi:MAG: MFS transporter [Syntrophorhabdaceae bacterium]|nr:MFS transporter [Syntrophorhabdaceae bacterium]
MDKKVFSWCLFDFANSSYSAVIAATIFPVYYANHVVGNLSGEGDLWWGRAIAVSMAIVALTSPFLGGMADYGGIRKRMMFLFTSISIVSVACFALLEKGMVIPGFVMIILANTGMEGGLVSYNAFLPEITEKDHHGRVSAWGFGVGYGGSILSLVLAIILLKNASIEIVWIMVALFFSVFSLPAFLYLPEDRLGKKNILDAAKTGFISTFRHLKSICADKNKRRFLIAYLIYEDGVNTVIVFSSIFAATTLGFEPDELIYMYLIVQATALAGAFIMASRIDIWGPKKVVIKTLCLWIIVTITAYFIQTKFYFVVLASMAGLGLGTLQAATRALYAGFIPKGEEARYFGVFNLVGKSSAILGPLVFGWLSFLLKSQRPAIISVALFFITGLAIISTVKDNKVSQRS